MYTVIKWKTKIRLRHKCQVYPRHTHHPKEPHIPTHTHIQSSHIATPQKTSPHNNISSTSTHLAHSAAQQQSSAHSQQSAQHSHPPRTQSNSTAQPDSWPGIRDPSSASARAGPAAGSPLAAGSPWAGPAGTALAPAGTGLGAGSWVAVSGLVWGWVGRGRVRLLWVLGRTLVLVVALSGHGGWMCVGWFVGFAIQRVVVGTRWCWASIGMRCV